MMRGLPFLSPLLLRGLESSTDVHGDEGEPLWAACPDGAGARVELKPSQIGFSHRSCSAHFQDGRTLRSTLTEILAGEVSPCNIEELRVFWHQGTYYTLGNRRLCVYRLLEHCRPNTKILVRVVSESEAEAWGWKPGVALASGLLCSSRPALRALVKPSPFKMLVSTSNHSRTRGRTNLLPDGGRVPLYCFGTRVRSSAKARRRAHLSCLAQRRWKA